MLSNLLGKVSHCDRLCRVQTEFPAKQENCVSYPTKMISVTKISPVSKQDLGTLKNFSFHMNAM